jgi:hypothetical protein
MTARARARPLTALLAVLLAATGALLTLQQLPDISDIQLRAHAVEQHGEDAIRARQGVFNCDADDLRIKLCPPSSKYGWSIYWFCDTGEPLCPGIITTRAGIEKTAFIRPCAQWYECK